LLIESTCAFAALAFEAAAGADHSKAVDEGIRHALFRSGLAMAPFCEGLGGAGLAEPENQGHLCTILRILGGADLSLARLFEGHVNAVSLVMRYGARGHADQLARDVQRGELSGVWGAEDAVGLKRIQQPGGWRLEGRKILASGAGLVTRPCVILQDADGPVIYLLDLAGDEGVDLSGWRALGMRSSATGTVDLTGITVSAADQIGKPGDYLRQPFFAGGAWRFCAAQLGAVERLAELYREQLLARGRDSDPYQLERLAQCVAAAGSASFWVEEAARRFGDESLEPAGVVAFANLTRMVTERAALDVMERVQRGLGLAAFIRPHPAERICRDLATYLRQPVPDLAMSDAARAVLDGHLPIGAVG
jgi:alkylation response protein AidB-like acyl-CoA dehydrogenase